MRCGNSLFTGSLLSLVCGISCATPTSPSNHEVSASRNKLSFKKTIVKSIGLKMKSNPLFKDFMGLNVHSVGFKPDLYKPVCRLVRDYHPMSWDLGDDTSNPLDFPHTRNNIVNWLDEYGAWKKTGYDIDVSMQFEQTEPGKWKDMAKDAFEYGKSFARDFGPSGKNRLVDSVEIGNEPANYSDSDYRTVFENMAKGIREGDPHLPIATCNVVSGKPDKYTKNIESIKGLESLYDVINIHTYAFAEPYPTWRRSFPEDPAIKYLPPVTDTIAWRNAIAPDKKIWITEFGWDSTTKPNLTSGDFKNWVGSTDTQQAQYLVRSFLVFSALDVDRAYIYYYDDEDAPTLHASSGLTRHLKPKPSFYAVSHLYKTLGNYRFTRAVTQDPGSLFVYEYQSASDSKDRIWAVWSPTGSKREAEVVLPAASGKIVHAEQMPLLEGNAKTVEFQSSGGKTKLMVDESPIYLWIQAK